MLAVVIAGVFLGRANRSATNNESVSASYNTLSVLRSLCVSRCLSHQHLAMYRAHIRLDSTG